MIRRSTRLALVLVVTGAFALLCLVDAHAGVSAQSASRPVKSDRTDAANIVGECPPPSTQFLQDAKFAFEHRDEACDLFGFVVCLAEPHFNATRARVRVTPTAGLAIDVVPGDAGEFEVRGVPSGLCRVRCEIEGYAPFEDVIEVADKGSPARLDIPMFSVHKARILLRDTHGARFSAADLSEKHSNLNFEFEVAVLDSMPKAGRIARDREIMPFEAASAHRDDARRPGQPWREVPLVRATPNVVCLVRDSQVLAAVEVAADCDEVTLSFDSSKIAARFDATIVDAETGSPLKGATVMLGVHPREPLVLNVDERWVPPRTSFATDPEGQLRDAWLPAGIASVIVCSAEHASFQTEIEVVAGKTLDLGIVRLPPGVSVSGVALLPTGAPAAERELHCWTAQSGDDWTRDFRTRLTDVNGQFLFEAMKRGVYEIGEYVEQSDNRGWWSPDLVGFERRGVGDASPIFAIADATRASVKNVWLTVVPPAPPTARRPR
jgi:hypothetical protein